MRLLWISFLLVGSITCQPIQDSGVVGGASPRGYSYPGYWVSGPASPDPTTTTTTTSGPVTIKPTQKVPYVPGYYSGHPVYYGGYPGVYVPQNPDQTPTQDPNEPFFSDVSQLDPVYNFHSRSRYRRGRARFAQTRYIPTEYGPVFSYPEYPPPKGYPKYPVKGY